jgi:hypothetical protein
MVGAQTAQRLMTKSSRILQEKSGSGNAVVVYDGPGRSVHCVFCQQGFESRQAYEESVKQENLKREHRLMLLFDAI